MSKQPEFKNQKRRQLGASIVEFALLLLLIAVIAVPVVKGLGVKVRETFTTTAAELNAGSGQVCLPGDSRPECQD